MGLGAPPFQSRIGELVAEDKTPKLSAVEGQVDMAGRSNHRAPYTALTFTMQSYTYLVSRLDYEPRIGRWVAYCGDQRGRGNTPHAAVERLAETVSELPEAPHKVRPTRDTEPVPKPS